MTDRGCIECGQPRVGGSPRCVPCRAARRKEKATFRQRARRRIRKHMARFSVDRATAVRQLTPVFTPEQSAEYTRRRLEGTLPKWTPGVRRGWEPTKRPRDRWRKPGTTPEARRRRAYRALRDRGEQPRERPRDWDDTDYEDEDPVGWY